MTTYTPALGMQDAGKNIRAFVEANKATLWQIFKPLLPYILLLDGLSILSQHMAGTESFSGKLMDPLFNLGSVYFYAFLAISWHRLVITGPDNLVIANPFKPTKNEIFFLGLMAMSVLIAVGCVCLFGIIPGLIFGPVMLGIGIFVGILVAVYATYKFSFLLPAKAVNKTMSIEDMLKFSKGYFWKLMGAGWFAAWRMSLLATLCAVALGIGVGITTVILKDSAALSYLKPVMDFIIVAVIEVYFAPILSVLGVTVLSNYYMHGIQQHDGR